MLNLLARSQIRLRSIRTPLISRLAYLHSPARPGAAATPLSITAAHLRTRNPSIGRQQASTMSSGQPEEGSSLTSKFTVLDSDLASATSPDPEDSYAHVLATPRLVSFMEIVCARMLVPHMQKGQLSVGVRVEMDHLAATPVGEEISVKATFLRKEGKQFVFDTVISDKGGEVGRGVCRRAVIDETRLLDGAKKRIGGGSKL